MGRGAMVQAANDTDAISRIRSAHRTLAILRVLAKTAYWANDRLLADILESLGLVASAAELQADLDGLERSGLVRLRRHDDLIVVELTARGGDAGSGRVMVEGVAPPGPECPY